MNKRPFPEPAHSETKLRKEYLPIGPPLENLDRYRDLLAVRERHVNALLPGILTHDHFVVGICARSGSSSAQLLLKEKLEKEGYDVVLAHAYPRTIVEAAEELKTTHSQKAVIFVDEAKRLEHMVVSGDYTKSPLWSERMDEALEFFSRARSEHIKLVFFTHDNYGKTGEGGMYATEHWLKTLPGFDQARVGMSQLECTTKEEIGQLYDALIKHYQPPQELEQFRQRIMETFVSPLQVSTFLSYARNVTAQRLTENPEACWKYLYMQTQDHDHGAFRSTLSTTGKKALFDLMVFLVDCGGPIPLSELTEDERALVTRYEKFHFFEQNGDLIDVRGTYVKDMIRVIEDQIEHEKTLNSKDE